jgi:hypothetical protein
MRHYSFQFSTGYASAWDQRSVHRQAELDKTTFDRVRSQFKKAASPSFGRQGLLDPFAE